MSFRQVARSLFQLTKRTTMQTRFYSSIQHCPRYKRCELTPIRAFSSLQTNDNAYRDLQTFLQKEIQLETSAQKHPSDLPQIAGFQVQANGPEVTFTRQTGKDRTTVKFNVNNTVNSSESDLEPAGSEEQKDSPPLKSRPTFTVEINRDSQTLSFLCSYLPNDYPESGEAKQGDVGEDFQIDEFTIHNGEWNETVYSSDCAVIDGELYDKLLNLLEEHGIGEEFANQLADYSTAYEHRQYIGLLEKLKKFVE